MTLLFKLGTGNILIGISILVKGVQLVLKVEEKVTRISVLADVSHIHHNTYFSPNCFKSRVTISLKDDAIGNAVFGFTRDLLNF